MALTDLASQWGSGRQTACFSEGGLASPSPGFSVALTPVLPDQGRHGWLWTGRVGIWVELELGCRLGQLSLMEVMMAEAGPRQTVVEGGCWHR